MGALAKRIDHFDEVKSIVTPVLTHFDQEKLATKELHLIGMAADLAFADDLLLEKFSLWQEEQDDEAFVFHIKRFFEKRDKAPLDPEARDLSEKRQETEDSIKNNVRENQRRLFAQRITQLALKHNLMTNEQLGNFLGVSTEQARRYRSGEHAPQLGTLKNISDKFQVPVAFLIGLELE